MWPPTMAGPRIIPYALCPMPYTLRPSSEVRSVASAHGRAQNHTLCPMSYALCPMPYTLRPSSEVRGVASAHGRAQNRWPHLEALQQEERPNRGAMPVPIADSSSASNSCEGGPAVL